ELAAGVSAEQETSLRQAGTDVDSYFDAARDAMGPAAINGDYATFFELSTQNAPVVTGAQEVLDNLAGQEDASAAAAARSAQDAYERQRMLAIVMLLAGLALAFGVGMAVARGIARAVGKVQHVAEGLAEGDLTRTSGLTTRDELGRMGAALDTAVVTMREVLASVASSADAVAASSEELSASSAQIS